MLSRLLKFVAEMLEDMEGAAFEGTLEQEHISMLSVKKIIESLENQKRGYGQVTAISTSTLSLEQSDKKSLKSTKHCSSGDKVLQ